MAAPELQFQRAPQANLDTWSAVTKLLFISAAVTAVVLLLMYLAFVA
jgi:hypothetical protein